MCVCLSSSHCDLCPVVSSEEEDEDMLFEYHIGSDTESGDNEQVGVAFIKCLNSVRSASIQ